MAADPDAVPPERGGEQTAPVDPKALQQQVADLQRRVRRAEDRRRALLHIMGDLNESNRKLAEQRKAMIHIMGDLRETTEAVERREQELRDKQEQLVQAAKLATLGELTTGVAHELNNPLNNIGLFVGNAIDRVRRGERDGERVVGDLEKAMEQVRKATEIITHLRTFGRPAPITLESVDVRDAINRALALTGEQLRQRAIAVELELSADDPFVVGNPIQLEQVFINLLTNARDALSDDVDERRIHIATAREGERVKVTFSDTGPGIPDGLEQRIFDPFFTTKEVGTGTGLGLSITYGIVKEHGGQIFVVQGDERGARFVIELPVATEPPPEALLA